MTGLRLVGVTLAQRFGKGLLCGIPGLIQGFLVMGSRYEAGFEGRRRQVHTGFEHAMEETIENLLVAFHHLGEVADHNDPSQIGATTKVEAVARAMIHRFGGLEQFSNRWFEFYNLGP